MSLGRDSCHQPPCGESRKQKLHSSWRMMTITSSFRGGKKIDPQPRRQMRSGKVAEASCEQPLPNTLQLNIEGLTQSKICVISQLATRHRALVILLQETQYTTPDQLVAPNFKLAGSTTSRKHGLATFVHEGLGWTLADDGVKTLMAWKSFTSVSHQHRERHHQAPQCSHTPVSMQVILTATM